MKKITLLMIFAILWTFNTNAQHIDENFESGTFPPAGWIDAVGTALTDNGDAWAESITQFNSTTTSAFFDDFGNAQDHDRWLISPALDLSAAVNPELLYFDRVNFTTFAGIQDVLWSEDYSGSGDPGLATWNSLNDVIGTEDTWVQNGPYPIVSTGTQVYIAFHYQGTFAAEWWIDDVLVRDGLTCTSAVVNGTSIVNDCDNGQFQIEVDVDSVGDGTFINDGANTFAITAGANIVGPYASGDIVTLTIEHSDSACDFTLSDVAFTCPTIPTIDGNLTVSGCLDSDSFTVATFDASVQNIYWIQLDYDGGCFELTADTDGSDFDTELGLYDSNGILVANNDDDAGGITPQSLFTEEALPAGTYYLAAGAFNMAFGADSFNATTTNTTATGNLVVNASTPSDNTVDFCNLQFPFEGAIMTGEDHTVYTQVYEAGVTEPQGAQGAGIEAWIGFSQTDAITTADFSTGWTWVVADYNVTGPASNNDEYFAEIGSARAAGTYYYVSRYSIDGGPFSYGGINPGGSDGNFWDGTNFVSGELTVTNPPPPANDECANAIALTVNPDYGCGTVTNGTVTSATNSGVDNCGGTEDDDVWYSFMATETSHRVSLINITGSTTDMYHAVYDATPGCGALAAAVICNDGNVSNLTGLTIGTTYYVQVYTWTATTGQTSVFDICIGTPPSCLAPTGLNANNETETTADLGWTENGTATTWNIEWGTPGFLPGAGTTETGVITNPFTLTGLTTETDYEFYVQADCGGGDLSTWEGPFAFSTLPPAPANDDCTGAIPLTPGGAFETNPIDGTVIGATTDVVANGCGAFGNGPGVWYSVVVPADGNITIETGSDMGTGNLLFDSVIEAFSGACGALTSIECDDDDAATGSYSLLDLTGLTPGETIYIRVWEYNGDESEPFSISAYNTTLSTSDFENEKTFTYFPNPVNNSLTLKALQNIQSISVLNVLGQQVLHTTPNALEDHLDMSSLNTGSYFVKVTINDVTETVRVIKK